MEFHYVISYNTETKKWRTEDSEAWFDGNVWDANESEFCWPRDDHEELIDQRCHNMLNALLPIWPEVDESYVS